MNLFSSRLVLRPRLLTEVLDLATPFCLAGARPLGRVALAVLGPLAALATGLRLGLGWGWPLVWALVLPLSFVAQGAFTLALGEVLFKPPGEIRVAPLLLRFARRLPALLSVQLTRLLMWLACAILVIPLAIEGPRWLLVREALLLEQATPGQAIRRSRSLGRDRAGFCLGLGLAVLALPFITLVLAELVGSTLLGFLLQLGQPLGSLADGNGSALAVAGLLLGQPLAAGARFLGYIDLRTRREGWDIQLRFTAWSERAGAREQGAA